MGFKVDTSFLKFLTMGALGVRRVAEELNERGFEPIELERYCMSNKIWATKVKRLRLPDLLCVRTGLRAEVRAKSDLRIRMSDAPQNPDRVWDAGLRDDDIVSLIACSESSDGPIPAKHAVYFSVEALRGSVGDSKLGPPKSASEGAERDRTWPSIVPSRPGRVLTVEENKLIVMMEGDGQPDRKQTYALNGKHPYVAPGDKFQADVEILAGAPVSLANIDVHLGNSYNPLDQIKSASVLDRYAGVKALRFRDDLHGKGAGLLEAGLDTEIDARVALEMAASASALKLAKGQERLAAILHGDGPTELSMEAILILTELKTPFAREQLVDAAGVFQGDERRQAAIWGLGKTGLKAYADLVPYISDEEENVAYHAIAAFGPDTPKKVIDMLVSMLIDGELRKASAASEALRVIGSADVLAALVETTKQKGNLNWLLATLGRLPPNLVRKFLKGTHLVGLLEPMLLIAHGASWLSTEDAVTDMAFLAKQNL